MREKEREGERRKREGESISAFFSFFLRRERSGGEEREKDAVNMNRDGCRKGRMETEMESRGGGG